MPAEAFVSTLYLQFVSHIYGLLECYYMFDVFYTVCCRHIITYWRLSNSLMLEYYNLVVLYICSVERILQPGKYV